MAELKEGKPRAKDFPTREGHPRLAALQADGVSGGAGKCASASESLRAGTQAVRKNKNPSRLDREGLQVINLA